MMEETPRKLVRPVGPLIMIPHVPRCAKCAGRGKIPVEEAFQLGPLLVTTIRLQDCPVCKGQGYLVS